jgi:hypothetical protein
MERGAEIFPDLRPLDGDRYEIELAAILSERLPSAQSAPEYVVTIAGSNAIDGLFCISNIMQVLRYRRGDVDRHAICPATAVESFLADHGDDLGSQPHREFAGTVVTARYTVVGTSADAALAEHLEVYVDDFIAGINRLVTAHIVSIDTDRAGILTPVYDRGSFPWIYLLMR